jgi:hypothetical protein
LASLELNFDKLVEENRLSAEMNFIGSTYRTKNYPYEYAQAVAYLREKLFARLDWLDNKMTSFMG